MKNPTHLETSSLSASLPVLTLTGEQHTLFQKIENTNDHYFIQGQAGTGKSTFIRYLQEHTHKKIRLLCPTAIAALHIGGVTIHSFFQLPLRDFLVSDQLDLKKKTINLLKKTDLIVIDEISMVRPDILDAMDFLLKKARGNFAPFGGVQMLFVGDLCQLPPVIKYQTSVAFRQKYGFENAYCFDAFAFKNTPIHYHEFKKVYRQTDDNLLNCLTDIRKKRNLEVALQTINQMRIFDESVLKTAITITPYRAIADRLNQESLARLPGDFTAYTATASGYFTESSETPAPRVLMLKKGAVVLLNKNNPPFWINGSTGVVIDLQEDVIKVRLFQNNKVVSVHQEVWQSFSYVYDAKTDTVEEKETGVFTQFPLQPGYALTIHKAQGKTLDKVILNVDRGAFAHGQMYVALSRTRKMSDIHISGTIKEADVILDNRIVAFLNKHFSSF